MVDYSKWKNIEISDDEDETHPNIDTPSLFRWRHQARVERMEEQKKDVDDYEQKKADYQKKMTAAKEKISDAKKTDSTNLAELQQALNELEKENEKNEKMGNELLNKEKKTPWNIDTISKPGFAKTLINVNPVTSGDSNLSEEQRESRMQKFFKEHEKELKHYGLLRKYEDSRAYLRAHDYLVSEDTANYLVIWCINLEMEQKHDLMEHVAHQIICIQYILELAKQLKCDPRACLDMFFAKIQVAEPEYRASFKDELRQFKERIVRRAGEKLEEAVKEVEQEEREKRLGPGGLDPVEVFESLPDELKQCFESQNIGLLQETITKMNEEDARYHMKRCVESGLWIPDAKKGTEDESESISSEEKVDT